MRRYALALLAALLLLCVSGDRAASAAEVGAALPAQAVETVQKPSPKHTPRPADEAEAQPGLPETFELFGSMIERSQESLEFRRVKIGDEGLDQIREALDSMPRVSYLKIEDCGVSDEAMADEAAKIASLDKHKEKFIEVMDDDLNTADGIAAIFELVSEINLDVKDGASKSFAEEALKRIRELTDVLGIFGGEDEEEGLGDDIQALIDERQAARKEKNWARADEIRDQLAAMGITLKDTPQGVQVIRN